MNAYLVLVVFIVLKFLQFLVANYLSYINRSYYLNADNRRHVMGLMGIRQSEMDKATAYSEDKYRFGMFSGWTQTLVFFGFLALGGFGYFESLASSGLSLLGLGAESGILKGLLFFGILGLVSSLWSLPFDYYSSFVIEEKHGFNRQTPKLFFVDRLKGLVLAMLLGGTVLSLVLYLMSHMGGAWWIWAWGVVSGFSILMAWIYPTFLAPLFNKFTPLKEGELFSRIKALSERVGFNAGEVFLMDASKRSSHGNAYFTGVFGKKRIVLFDTLVDSMEPQEVEAVLAHELGHFKLHHVRWALIRSVVITGVVLYLLNLALPLKVFYESFAFDGISHYAALVVFSMWFSLIEFFLAPIGSWLSRKNEFAADAFASEFAEAGHLVDALKKLRESNAGMPLCHPAYSMVYHSHPPLPERIDALLKLKPQS